MTVHRTETKHNLMMLWSTAAARKLLDLGNGCREMLLLDRLPWRKCCWAIDSLLVLCILSDRP